MENLKPEPHENIEDIKGTGFGSYEASGKEKTSGQSEEAPKKWTPEEEQSIRKIAYEIFEKRMRGQIPAEEVDKTLRENNIEPWTPEAQKFMEKWDWHEAEKEFVRRKEQPKEAAKEEVKVDIKEGAPKAAIAEDQELRTQAKKELEEAVKEVGAIKPEEMSAEVTPEALVAAGVAPEVANLPEQVQATKEAVVAEVAKLPEEVRQRVGFSLANMGYWIERWKGEGLASAVEKAQNKLNPQERSWTDNFLSAIREKSARDAEVADKKMQDMEKNRKALRIAGSAGYVGKNVYNVARPITDIVGWTAALPLRFVSMIGAGVAVTADILKETQLKSTEVIEKTRIQDVDAAMEEAIRVYEKAGGVYDPEKGGNGVGPEALKKAYLEDIPVSIKERLSRVPEAGILSRLTNGIFRKHIERSVGNLNKKIAKIEAKTDWNQIRKDYEKERVFNNYRKRLNDFDRMLGQAGAVDTTAMLAKYEDYAGKAIVAGTAVLMLKPAFDKFWDWLAGGTADRLPDIVGENGPSWEELLGIDLKDGLDMGEARKIADYMLKRLEAGDKDTAGQMLDRYGDMEIQGPAVKITFREWWNTLLMGPEPPKFTVPWEDLIDNKGIIGHDSIWQSTKHIVEAHAQEMGYTGDLNDTAALDKWAETQTANLVNTLAESQGGKVKDLVHGGPDIGEYDKVIVHKVDGKWVLDFKAESGIEPGYLPEKPVIPEVKITPIDFEEQQRQIAEEIEKAGSANSPEYKMPETPPQETTVTSSELPKSDLVKEFEKLSGEPERQAFTYNYVLSQAKDLNLSKEKAWAFSRTFAKDISYIDTPEEIREALSKFDRQLGFTREVLARGELPVTDKAIFVMENTNGQMFDLEHPAKDVYRVIKRLPDGRSQYISNGWLGGKDFKLEDVKKFLGVK